MYTMHAYSAVIINECIHLYLPISSGRHHYEQALKVRQLIYDDFKSLFQDKVDVLLTPVSLGPPPMQKVVEDMGPVESSVHDTFTVPVNLAGIIKNFHRKRVM